MFENIIKAKLPHVSLIPEALFSISNIEINSAYLSSFLATLIILILGILIKVNLKYRPGRFQLIFEEAVGFFYENCKISFEDNVVAKRYVSFILSLFIFIFIQNQIVLIPFVQSIVLNHQKVFIPSTAHLSQTLTLALLVLGLAHFSALIKSPLHHIYHLLNLHEILKVKSLKDIPNSLLQVFLGVLHIFGEFTKVISLSVRLFGNIFAGEVMVAVVAGISVYTMFIAPIPFMILGIFAGIIQAFVFSFLATAFISDTIKK